MKVGAKTNLTRYYFITGNDPHEINHFLQRLTKCLENGMHMVQLRVKTIPISEYKILAEHAIKLCHQYNARIIINDNIQIAEELGAHGVHLTSATLLNLSTRPLNEKYIVAASCHNKIELLHAKKVKLDFVTLSPVLPTTSHPQTVPLGWERFQKLSKLVDLPVFALGGLNQNSLEIAVKHGAYGIAAINAFWMDK